MDRGAWWAAVQRVAQSQTQLKKDLAPTHLTTRLPAKEKKKKKKDQEREEGKKKRNKEGWILWHLLTFVV